MYAQIYVQHHPDRLLSLFLCSPGSGTGRQWKDAMLEVARYTKNRSSLVEWLNLNIYSALGLLGSDRAYQKFYCLVLTNFNRGFREDQPEHFRFHCIKAKVINQTTKNILTAPVLPVLTDPGFRITIVYGNSDIFGESNKYIIQRHPSAAVLYIPESGHLSWSHNLRVFEPILQTHFNL
ncbi:hypothetical protein AAE02nite_47040 [Adhaeribacter aerolatus]|uniref:AB hydrolase-1 domain-containing protein n=1 Tax=Adhaeribacter aerolatus TaxID=670289 RepID=A0A512B512_9BACT|nr:hypothetical protein AAE02nite_47040 [Adhaeribacter aerolatus]